MHKTRDDKNDKDLIKVKIMEYYKDTCSESLFSETLLNDYSGKRVAIYLRIAEADSQETSSYELLKNHYINVVSQRSNWDLVKIYVDEVVSGSFTKNHNAFNKMIADCEAGKIDLIITNSIPRFSRNIVDVISYVNKLRDLNPPVGVFFESEQLYSLSNEHVNILEHIETLSREESKMHSKAMKHSYELRRKRGLL